MRRQNFQTLRIPPLIIVSVSEKYSLYLVQTTTHRLKLSGIMYLVELLDRYLPFPTALEAKDLQKAY